MFRIELLFIFSFITCHSRILQCLEFNNFCSFAVCCSFPITCAWNTAEYRLNEIYCVRFQLFVYGFIFSLKEWAYRKYERVLLHSKTDRFVGFSSPSLSFFLINKLLVVVVTFIFVVKYWITVSSSEKVIVCFPMSVLRENIIHLTVIFFFRYCEV